MASDNAAVISVNDVCDYIIVRLNQAPTHLSVLKLHKLIYYVQAWHLAFFGVPMFNSGFEAWVHGPVSRTVYDRFKDMKSMYSRVTVRDVRDGFSIDQMSNDDRLHINSVLETYAEFADTQLEEMTHRELPWIQARGTHEPNERCQDLISNDTMESYYSARLKKV